MFAKRLEIAVGLAIQRLRLKIDGWKASRARKKALKERVRTLRRGAEAWNRWRRMNPSAPLDLPESRIRRVNLCGANLSEVNLGRACFDRVDLRKADLSGAGLSNARFLDVDLREANLSGADLSKVIFSRVDLRKADLSGANLSKTGFGDVDLRKADLSRANMPGSNFTRVNLRKTNLSSTILSRAEFREADLSKANLTEAALSKAAFEATIAEFRNTFMEHHVRDGVPVGPDQYISSSMSPQEIAGRQLADLAKLQAFRERYPNTKGAGLSDAVLCKAELTEARLREVDLSRADLTETRLAKAQLARAKLCQADLSRADLTEADLTDADLTDANLTKAVLSRTRFSGAKLHRTHLQFVDLAGIDLGETDLSEVILRGAKLANAKFARANLSNADLSGADLTGADFNGADLTGTDLSEAILCEANLEYVKLIKTNLRNADLTGCRIYGISIWDSILDRAIQQSLVVTKEDQPTITVDNIQVGQFIHTLIENKNIRSVIDTITAKLVLILGRFTPEHEVVLEALRKALRNHDYLPVLFKSEQAASRDITETVSLLARLARFVVAHSVKKPWDSSWKTNCRMRIRGCAGVIGIITPSTPKADGQLWELKCAVDENKLLLLIHGHSDQRPASTPRGIEGRMIYRWTWDRITEFVDSL